MTDHDSPAADRDANGVFERITADETSGFDILAVGVNAEPDGVTFLCFVNETPGGDTPTYVLYWRGEGLCSRYECTDEGYEDDDGRRVFSALAEPVGRIELRVSSGDDRRMRLLTADELLWFEPFSLDFVRLHFDGRSFRLESPVRMVRSETVIRLRQAAKLFNDTNGSTDVHRQLSELLAGVLKYDSEDIGHSVGLPMWLLGWLQQLLANCGKPQNGIYLYSPFRCDRLGAPMFKLSRVLERYRLAAAARSAGGVAQGDKQ